MARLTDLQVLALIEATRDCFGDNATLWLFGSRVNDEKRGGDIDLYIETDLKTDLVAAKLEMRSKIWSTFGDQKIDILVRSRRDKPTPMHEIAKTTGIELYRK